MHDRPARKRLAHELRELRKNADSPSYAVIGTWGGQQDPPVNLNKGKLSSWFGGTNVPDGGRPFTTLIDLLEAKALRKSSTPKRGVDAWQGLRKAAEQEKRCADSSGDDRPTARPAAHAEKDASHERRDHVFRKHRAWVEDHVLSAELLGREEELRELEAFCTAADTEGRSAYAWWQAEPWAGKSALMAEFVVQRRPTDVEVVSYFIGDRFGNNDRDSFLEEVTRQLAAVADRDASPSGGRPEDFPELCQAAAEACRGRGRRLVLLVDGLDEDRGVGPDGLSIAALLPRNLPLGMRAVITGRPNPPVLYGTHEDHPLRNPGIVRPLTAAPQARVIRDRAEKELQRLLKDQPVGNRLLGLLAVARGGLTDMDLATLVDVQPHEIRERLQGITGRSFVAEDRGHIVGEHTKAGSRTYVLGHAELLKAALDGLGDAAVAEYEARLHDWVDGYLARDWRDAPSYLLYDYTGMLRLKGDTARLTSFVLAPGRQQVLLDRASVDTALSEVELTRRVIEREALNDLAALAALAAARDILAERARALPLSIVLAFAELGYPQRALDLARSSPHPADKGIRLAQVARVLAGTGHEHAPEAAQEAARWAEQARREAAREDEDHAEAAAGEAAVALILVGLDRQGRELLNSLSPYVYGDTTFQCQTAVEASHAARTRNPALAEELLDQAERLADEVASPGDLTAPITAWEAIAEAARPERAARLYGRIGEFADTYPSSLESADVLASAASALAASHPGEAATRAQRAGQLLGAALRAPELADHDASHLSWHLGTTLAIVARALADTGAADDARELVASVPDTMRTGEFEEDVLAEARSVIDGAPRRTRNDTSAEDLAQLARALVGQGKPDEAKQRLHEAMESFAQSPEGIGMRRSWLIPLAGALASTGDPAAGERLAKGISAPDKRGQALAVVSTVRGTAGHTADARRLAHEAADLAASLDGADDYSLLNGAPGIHVSAVKAAAAHALAFVGEVDRAVSLVEEAGDGDTQALRRARLALAAGLRAHAPDRAARLLQETRDRLYTDHDSRARRLQRSADSAWSGLVTEHGELLVAAGTTDRTCRDWLKQALQEALSRSQQARSPQDELLIVILAARSHPDSARRRLKWLQTVINPYEYPEVSVGCAVAHAVLGDLTTAWQTAKDHAVPIVRAEALASVAAHLARIPVDLFSAITSSDSDSFRRVLHSLALMQTSADAKDLDQSHRFLSGALTGEGWHHALPTLANIAPDAVTSVGDAIFDHLDPGRCRHGKSASQK